MPFYLYTLLPTDQEDQLRFFFRRSLNAEELQLSGENGFDCCQVTAINALAGVRHYYSVWHYFRNQMRGVNWANSGAPDLVSAIVKELIEQEGMRLSRNEPILPYYLAYKLYLLYFDERFHKRIEGPPLLMLFSSLKVFNIWLFCVTGRASHAILVLHRSPVINRAFATHAISARVNNLRGCWEFQDDGDWEPLMPF